MMNNSKLLVISAYSPKDQLHGSKYSAVAGYTKNTLTHLSNYNNLDIVVLADILDKKEIYKEDNVTIDRFWERNGLFLYFKLLKKIFKYPQYKKILLEFEFGMFGGNKLLIMLLPFFIFILKLLQKEITVVSHGVILSASEVSGQLGLQKDNIKTKLMDKALKILYFFTCLFSDKVIVFEEYLKEKLVAEVGFEPKIIWIPHGVEKSKGSDITKREARAKLGLKSDDFILLNFGFVIWYKGSDWLIKTFGDLLDKKKFDIEKTKLVVAGSFSKTHEKDFAYQKYTQELSSYIEKRKNNIVITGFVKDEDIEVYFKAADLVVMPYRVLISASGPFSFILKTNSPFILSKALEGYQLSPDFNESMIKSDLSHEDIFFELNSEDFEELIKKYQNNPKLINNSQDLSHNLYKMRLWSEIGKMYTKVLFG